MGNEQELRCRELLDFLAFAARLKEAGPDPNVADEVVELARFLQVENFAHLLTFDTFDDRTLRHERYLSELAARIEQKVDTALLSGFQSDDFSFARLRDNYLRTQTGLTTTRQKIGDIHAAMNLMLTSIRRKIDRLLALAWTLAILLSIAIGVMLFALYKVYYQQSPGPGFSFADPASGDGPQTHVEPRMAP